MTIWQEKLGKDYRLEIYLHVWGLERDPFTPDLPAPEAFVPSQREELIKLKEVLMEGRVAVLTGGLGMGKTAVCKFLTAALREENVVFQDPARQVIPVMIHGAAYRSAEEFLRAIILGLELDSNMDSVKMFEVLRKWGIEQKEKLAIIVDDVPESTANFKELGEFFRVLADLPGISLLLNGEEKRMENFLEKIPALKDRVYFRMKLRPLTLPEVRELLIARMRYCSREERDFMSGPITADGFQEIYKVSKGVPRQILAAASKALRLAAIWSSPINAQIVRMANRETLRERLAKMFLRKR
ncbi:MAG: AAA family ATPase [Candidatus Hadarchaeales archaeon]